MKTLLLICVFCATQSFGQVNQQVWRWMSDGMNGPIALDLKALIEQRHRIDSLHMEWAQTIYAQAANAKRIEELRQENIRLREEMRQYMIQLEELRKKEESEE